MYPKLSRQVAISAVLILAVLTAVLPIPSSARSLSTQPAAHAPQDIPPTMPVFSFQPNTLNVDKVLQNAGLFNGVGATTVDTAPSPGGAKAFFALGLNSGAVVSQYDQTGGLFIIRPGITFTETPMVTQPTNTDICLFLANRQLFPNEVEPRFTDCRSNPAYNLKTIELATLEPGSGNTTNTIIGAVVDVPLAIDIGAAAPNYIPLGGPGGHLSLFLGGDPASPGLDDTLGGLQGVALPMFGRNRNAVPIGFYPSVPPAEAVRRFEAGFPESMQVSAGTPLMVYYVNFPDTPQQAMMPTWTFPDATGIISGTQVNFKNMTIPGVDGFAPQVTISEPADGKVFLRNQPVPVKFNIAGDQGPFTYTVSVDNLVVASGVTVSGTLQLDLGPLPPGDDRPEGRTISVEALNTYHVSGQDSVFLGTVQSVYLPVMGRNSSALNAAPFAVAPRVVVPVSPARPAATLRIGVEWVMDYHNPDSNLGQTKPDAEGLYNWLGFNGWQKKYNWGNDAAWEKDWRDCSLGGIDCTLGVDRAEFTYFSGHGSPAAWYFGVNKDYGGAWAGNARFNVVRWAGFSSCQTLRGGPYVGPGNPPVTDFFNSFQGSYMMLGFHSNMGDIPFGSQFGWALENPLYNIFPWIKPSIREAWVNTAFAMNAGKPAYLYAVGNFDPVNFKLPPSFAGPLPALTGIWQYRWVWWNE